MSANNVSAETEASRILYQLACIELAEAEARVQMGEQAFSENGIFWRKCLADLAQKRMACEGTLAKLVPSGHFTYRPLFRVYQLNE